MAVFRNMWDLTDTPTFVKPCCADSPDSPRFAKSCCADSPDLPTFAKPCCADSPDSRKASFGEYYANLASSGESGKFRECRLDHFMHIKYVIFAKNDLSYHAGLRQHSPSGLASTPQTRRHLPTCFAWTCQTRQRSPTCFARTRQTRPHSPKVIRTSNFGEFGASGHCLAKTLVKQQFMGAWVT
jgi:hypothetical protein